MIYDFGKLYVPEPVSSIFQKIPSYPHITEKFFQRSLIILVFVVSYHISKEAGDHMSIYFFNKIYRIWRDFVILYIYHKKYCKFYAAFIRFPGLRGKTVLPLDFLNN